MIQTIRDWIENVLGTYEPITYTVKDAVAYTGMDSVNYHEFSYQRVADGLAGVDWGYIATAALLLIAIWSVFRLLGVLLQAISGGK